MAEISPLGLNFGVPGVLQPLEVELFVGGVLGPI
jgi:hypothetical protein